MKSYKLLTSVFLGTFWSAAAFGQTVTDADSMGRHIGRQFGGIGVGLSAVFYIAGLLAFIYFLIQLKKHSSDRGDAKASHTLIALVVGVLSFAIPQAIGVGIGSLFGSTNNTVDQNTQGIRIP